MKALDAIRASGKGCSAAVLYPESSPGEREGGTQFMLEFVLSTPTQLVGVC